MRKNRKRVLYLLCLILIVLITNGSSIDEVFPKVTEVPGVGGSEIKSFTLAFAGDIMAHDVNYNRKPYNPIYDGIQDLVWEADLSFANLEFVFDPKKPPRSYPYFNAPPDYVKAAILGGFNVFSLANNHSLDMGTASIFETIEAIEDFAGTHRLYYNGICKEGEERLDPLFFEVGGVKFGFLAVTSFLNRHINSEYINVVPFYDDEAIEDFVVKLKAETKSAEVFILSYHGGVEYSRQPSPWKQDLFKRFIDAGVDIVWGHHPHVVQPWETVVTPHGEKLILYSCGNLISGQTWTSGPQAENPERNGTGESALFMVELLVQEDNVTARRIHAVPVCNYRDLDAGMVVKLFDSLSNIDMSDDWAVYYRDRFRELETYLVDVSPWLFVR